MAPVLTARNLQVSFPGSDNSELLAVDGVDIDVADGEVLGIVGESGAGKSVAMMATLGLLPSSARVTAERLEFRGRPLLSLNASELRRIRNQDIGVVFQDPMTSLNPTFTIGYQIGQTLRMFNRSLSKEDARRRIVELLDMVGIPNPERRWRQYPHEYSGGMRQRAMIAMAIANQPSLLVADEPTTALDVTIQSQILDVLQRAAEETGAATVLITHDLGVVAETSDRVMVMYAGKVVEQAPVDTFFASPRHFYTAALLASLPSVESRSERQVSISGNPVSASNAPSGCAFYPRCAIGRDNELCSTVEPELTEEDNSHFARCHFSHLVSAYDDRDSAIS